MERILILCNEYLTCTTYNNRIKMTSYKAVALECILAFAANMIYCLGKVTLFFSCSFPGSKFP